MEQHRAQTGLMQGQFNIKLFQSLNPDPKLLAELCPTQLEPGLSRSIAADGTSKEDLVIQEDRQVPRGSALTTDGVSPTGRATVAAEEGGDECEKLDPPPLVCMST